MKVVLLERVQKLGQMGDIVDVKSGYARNFLLPFRKALRATEQNIQYYEKQKSILEAKNIENIKEAESLKAKINGISFTLIRSASDAGALYGSVSAKDIMDVVSENGIVIAKNQINLEKPIKELGIYKIIVSLHPEISSEIIINVARTDEEAKLQEKGKENNFSDAKSSKNEEDNVEIDKMFDDESMVAKINNDNTANASEEATEPDEQKQDTSEDLPKTETKNISK
jgi:large subunit ribosomal protein L9